MAELHESVLMGCRRKFLKKEWHERKTPIRGYLPDLFIQKINKEACVVEEIILEAEIESTLHTEHTAEQLMYMYDYISRQAKKKIKVRGFLAIPKGKRILLIARMILFSQFPDEKKIQILQM